MDTFILYCYVDQIIFLPHALQSNLKHFIVGRIFCMIRKNFAKWRLRTKNQYTLYNKSYGLCTFDFSKLRYHTDFSHRCVLELTLKISPRVMHEIFCNRYSRGCWLKKLHRKILISKNICSHGHVIQMFALWVKKRSFSRTEPFENEWKHLSRTKSKEIFIILK